MPQPSHALIGSIVERKPLSIPSAPSKHDTTGRTGFPAVQHRSKSAFSRARSEQLRSERPQRSQIAPLIVSSKSLASPLERTPGAKSPVEWRRQMEEENMTRVENMTEEEREHERRDIVEKFGPRIGDVLRRAREVRQREEKPKNEASVSEEIPPLEIPSLLPRVVATPRKSTSIPKLPLEFT